MAPGIPEVAQNTNMMLQSGSEMPEFTHNADKLFQSGSEMARRWDQHGCATRPHREWADHWGRGRPLGQGANH
eukprot:5010393-Karenia_brevis.AAC.1